MISTVRAGVLIVSDPFVCLVQSLRGDQWCLPKGHIEAGETIEEAAVREAWEEANVYVGLTKRLTPTTFHLDYLDEDVTCHWFQAIPIQQPTPLWLLPCKQDARPIIWVHRTMALELVKIPDFLSVLKEG